jgi:hypothetical protein
MEPKIPKWFSLIFHVLARLAFIIEPSKIQVRELKKPSFFARIVAQNVILIDKERTDANSPPSFSEVAAARPNLDPGMNQQG